VRLVHRTPKCLKGGGPEWKRENVLEERPFGKQYKLGKELGQGAFSVVRVGTSMKDNSIYAVKIITKDKLTEEDEMALQDEIEILNSLEHENVIRLYGVFDERKHYYLVTEMMNGGELFDRIVEKEFYNEKEARDVSKILFDAIAYCHSRNVAHRDLKPENLLLAEKNENTQIKIADFGFAKVATSSNSLKTQCGTPNYVAPEILNGQLYGTQVDNWSLGVILFTLLGGYLPFDAAQTRILYRNIRNGNYEFKKIFWKDVSNDAKNLIQRLLTVDAKKRITSEQALKHKWILKKSEKLEKSDLGANLEEFKKFNVKRKFRGAVKALIIAKKFESLGSTLRDEI